MKSGYIAFCILFVATAGFGASSKPAAPTNLGATPVASGTIQVTWSDNSSNETQFYLDRTTNGFAAVAQFVLGANVTSFLDTNLLPRTAYWYRVRAYNNAGYSSYSNTNSATTWSAPGITQQPQSPMVAVGSDARFSVSATGTEPLSYEWRFDGLGISGATSSNLTLASVQVTNAGNYTVLVSNAVGRRSVYLIPVERRSFLQHVSCCFRWPAHCARKTR